jgi:hypothetical protein
VFGGGHERPGPQAVAALVAADLRHGHTRAEIRVLAGALDDAAPARIARDVDHRCEGPVQPGRSGLLGGDTRGALFGFRSPGGRQRQRHGEDGPVAVHHVHGKQQRDAQARLFHRDLLQPGERLGAGHMQIRAHRAGTDALELGIVETRIQRFAAPAGALHELADLFVQGHLLE